MTLKHRLAKIEQTVGVREPKSAGPLVLVVALSAEGGGSFSAGGATYEVGTLDELDACIAAHGWQPERLIFRLPDLDRSAGAQARFCVLARDST